MNNRPQIGELYRHFKGNLYQVIAIATHSETREELVIYQALYGNYGVYARPLSMFMSEVDHRKYPDIVQKMRFELISKEALSPDDGKKDVTSFRNNASTSYKNNISASFRVSDYTYKPEIPKNEDYMNKSLEEEAAELNMNPLVVKFLDSNSAKERMKILDQLRNVITDEMIDTMAMAIEVQIEPGDVYDRLGDLRDCLMTVARFETDRLR